MMQQQEALLGKVLTPKQQARVKQIALQRDGMFALARPDMAERLNMDEGQIEQIQGIMQEMQGSQREAGAAMRERMKSMRRADGSFDRDAMKAQMESPEGKAQMEQQRNDAEKLRDQASTAIGRVLRKKQKDNYKKMIGAPFDVSKLNQFGPGGPGGPGAAPKAKAKSTVPGDDSGDAETPKAKSADDDSGDGATPKAKATDSDPDDDAPKPAAKTKKKSARRKGTS